VITAFLGKAPRTVVTPPLDAYGSPIAVPTASASSSVSGGSPVVTTGATLTAQSVVPSYDPKPC
jgi:hypothetical protein